MCFLLIFEGKKILLIFNKIISKKKKKNFFSSERVNSKYDKKLYLIKQKKKNK
jgi:hypothetical protein